ncbi:MAG: M48 family metallopeptidase [Bacteroidetes bacterium]|nr:M48 family metallopeptidase [Bacteroidota bacterium]
MKKIVFILFGCLYFQPSSGQDFIPLKPFTDRNSVKWKAIAQRTGQEIDKINSPQKDRMAAVLKTRFEFLEREFKNKKYIADSTIQNRVDQVWNRLLTHNTLRHQPGGVLISNAADINAYSFGEGTIIVNIGLLARLRNESQLAYALAHELAHYELNHTLLNIAKQIEQSDHEQVEAALANIRAGNISSKDYAIIKTWVLATTHFQRQEEVAADSLGFILFKLAGYRQDQASRLLKILDSAQWAKHHPGEALFNPLNFAGFPFKQIWLKEPKTGTLKDSLREIFLDSLRSHPHIHERLAALSKITVAPQGRLYFTDAARFQRAVQKAEFQCVQSAFENNRFDQSLFYALQLKPDHPGNQYITTLIGRVLLSLNIQRRNSTAYRYVPGSSLLYRHDWKAVINLLNNIDLRDLSEITFRFINLKGNFNAQNEEHYFILWKVCLFTDRWETARKVKTTYQLNFPHGEYIEDMMTY